MNTEEQKEEGVDLDALQDSIDESQSYGVTDENKGGDLQSAQNEGEKFDIDQALESHDGFEPFSLEGKITAEEAVEKATERGWTAEGKGDKYGHKISAMEFLERTPFYRKMNLMRGDIDDVKNQNKKLVENSKKIALKAVEDNKTLNAELKEARAKLLDTDLMDKDDINKLNDIDQRIAKTETIEQVDDVSQYDEASKRFESENKWYNENRAMRALADQVGVDFAMDYKNKHGILPDPKDTFQHVLAEVEKDFPDMGKPAARSNRVASTTNRTISNKAQAKKTLSDLPDDMQSVAKNVMAAAGLSEEEYMKTYEA